MPKLIDNQFTYKKQILFTKQQQKAFEVLKKYDVNINNFIRIAIAEKIKRDWKMIKEEKEQFKYPF